jgi:hypothetical protein
LKRIWRYIVLTFLLTSCLPSYSQDELKILFIGSSYFNYNNLPELFKLLSFESGKELLVDQYIPSGLFLADHAENSITQSKIKSENWDYVILQGSGPVLAYPDSVTEHQVYPAIKKLMKNISRNNSATLTVFCMPWAFEDGMKWKGWGDDYDEMQQKIIITSVQYARELGFMLAPVGLAWSRVLKEKDYPQHYLHFRDWNHPTKRGSYLMACVLYATIFGEMCADISDVAGMEPEEALYFREIALKTVLDSFLVFKKPAIPN